MNAEQQRKKDIAMNEAINHHQYASVMGMREKVTNMEHNMVERFNPYSGFEKEERGENGRDIHNYKFNEASYRR